MYIINRPFLKVLSEVTPRPSTMSHVPLFVVLSEEYSTEVSKQEDSPFSNVHTNVFLPATTHSNLYLKTVVIVVKKSKSVFELTF